MSRCVYGDGHSDGKSVELGPSGGSGGGKEDAVGKFAVLFDGGRIVVGGAVVGAEVDCTSVVDDDANERLYP